MDQEMLPRATLDRIEQTEEGRRLAVLVLDDGQQLVLPLEWLPEDTCEGTVLEISFSPIAEETEARAEEIADLQQQLFGEQG